jgi:hypothetical protein
MKHSGAKIMMDKARVKDILQKAKELAREYHSLTGKPLGITGEIAEFEAAFRLDLELAKARQPGYDAVEKLADGSERRLQIKGRRLLLDSKPGQRTGSIDVSKSKKWDSVILVLLDENFEIKEIHEAKRKDIERELKGSSRCDLHVSKFKSIGSLRWPPPAKGK